MNILFVVHEYPPLGGGGAQGVAALISGLARRHQIAVLTSGNPAPDSSGDGPVVFRTGTTRGGHAGLTARDWAAFTIRAAMKGPEIVRAHGIQLVNSHFAVPGGVAGWRIAQRCRLPHIVSAIGADIHDPSRWLSPTRNFPLRMIVSRILRAADGVTVLSHDMANRVERLVPGSTPTVLPYPINPPPALPPRPTPPPWRLLTVCRLVRRKQIEVLLAAVARLEQAPVRLDIVGEGPSAPALQNMAVELGIADRVRFHGYVPLSQRWALAAQAHMFLMVSAHEAQGLAYLEAMAAGLPVIAGATGGQRDFVEHGREGFITSAAPEEIAGQLSIIFDQPHIWQTMSALAQRRAQEYQPETISRKWEAVFEGIMETRT